MRLVAIVQAIVSTDSIEWAGNVINRAGVQYVNMRISTDKTMLDAKNTI